MIRYSRWSSPSHNTWAAADRTLTVRIVKYRQRIKIHLHIHVLDVTTEIIRFNSINNAVDVYSKQIRDRTPPCRMPQLRPKNSETTLCHLIQVIPSWNQSSNTSSKLLGMPLSIRLTNKPWWFILPIASEMSNAQILTVEANEMWLTTHFKV